MISGLWLCHLCLDFILNWQKCSWRRDNLSYSWLGSHPQRLKSWLLLFKVNWHNLSWHCDDMLFLWCKFLLEVYFTLWSQYHFWAVTLSLFAWILKQINWYSCSIQCQNLSPIWPRFLSERLLSHCVIKVKFRFSEPGRLF